MAELTSADVELFTNGRLENGDPEVERMLAAALVRARRYVGWPVSPVREESITVDGPGVTVVQFPTRNLIDIPELSENGTAADVSSLEWSRLGAVRKSSGRCWTGRYGGIVATIEHGYTEDEAQDWRQAVMSMVDHIARLQQSGRNDSALLRKKVDDVEYQWTDYGAAADQAIFSVASTLDEFRLNPAFFA